MKQTWRATLGAMRRHAWMVLAVHLAYTALGVIILAPMLGGLLQWLLALSGEDALADQEIAFFLLSPAGLFSLLLLSAVVIAIAALEQASLMAIAVTDGDGSRGLARLLRLLVFAGLQARRMLLFTLWLVARLLLWMAPFLAVGAAVGMALLTRYDINFYLTAKPPEFWLAVGLGGLLLLAMLVIIGRRLLRWCLALPLLLFADVAPRRSFATSERLTAGHRRVVFGVLALWLLLVLGLGGLLLSLLGGLAAWVVPWFQQALPLLAVVLGGFALLSLLLHLFLGAFAAGSFAFALLALSRRCGADVDSGLADSTEQASEQIERRVRLPGLAMGLLLVAVLAAAAGLWLVNSVPAPAQPDIIAHRGAAASAPENTLASVQRALDEGADWIEIDVQETADGEVVVFHDSDFMKLAGVATKVWDGTFAELREIDIGSWFGAEFAGERLPTLREVLDAADGRAKVVIELKYYGHDQQLEQRVVDIVEAAAAAQRVAIMSLSYAGVRKLHALRPDWTIGLLAATAIGDLSRREVDFLAVSSGMASAAFIRRAQAAGKQLWVWTVNDPLSMSRMMSLGVDGIITDEPALALAVRGEQAQMSRVERLLMHAAMLFGQAPKTDKYRDQSP